MINSIFEFSFSLIDYTYLLYFYLRLINKKISKRRFIVGVIIISLIQFIAEYYNLARFMTSLRDATFIVCFLVIISGKFSKENVINALVIEVLFGLLLTIALYFSHYLPIDFNKIYQFGFYRNIYTIGLKCFIIPCFYFIIKYLQQIKDLVKNNVYNWIACLLCFSEIVISYVIQIMPNDKQMNLMFFLLFVIIIGFIVVSGYVLIQTKNYELKTNQYIVDLISFQTKSMINEYNKIKEIVHDTKNSLYLIESGIEKGEYDSLKVIVDEWMKEYANVYSVAISKNLFVDAILKQYVHEFKNIQFNINMHLSNDFNINEVDLITILTHLLHMSACDKQAEKTLMISLIGNENELSLAIKNCRDYCDINRFSISALKNIVKRYNGDFHIREEGNFVEFNLLVFF